MTSSADEERGRREKVEGRGRELEVMRRDDVDFRATTGDVDNAAPEVEIDRDEAHEPCKFHAWIVSGISERGRGWWGRGRGGLIACSSLWQRRTHDQS